MPGTRARVLLLEANALLREGLAKLLPAPFRVVAEASTIIQALALMDADPYLADMAVVGTVDPPTAPIDRAPIEAALRLQSLPISLPVVLLARADADVFVIQAVQARCHGIMTRAEGFTVLHAALEAVRNGIAYLSPVASTHAYRHLQNGANPAPYLRRFSPRELAILNLLAKGWGNKEIAANLGIRPNTVRSYRKSMMRRLGVHNATELLNATQLDRVLKPVLEAPSAAPLLRGTLQSLGR